MAGLTSNQTNQDLMSNTTIRYRLKDTTEWIVDDGQLEWPLVGTFIWIMTFTIICFLTFCCNRKVRSNRSTQLSLNIILSIFIHELVVTVTFIYHDAIGAEGLWAFGVHYCRFYILLQIFTVSLQSFSILLVTIDCWLQRFSSVKYNERLSSKKYFTLMIISPTILAVFCVLIIMLPFTPKIGRVTTYGSFGQCSIDLARGTYYIWIVLFTMTYFILPAGASLIIASKTVIALCKRRSAYQSFSGAPPCESNVRNSENRMNHIIVATFVMNLLFVILSSPFIWTHLSENYKYYYVSIIVYRIYWCLLPFIWLSLQPELVAIVTAPIRRCRRVGFREMVNSCMNCICLGRPRSEDILIREYNVESSMS